jgi:hypothetical protein
MCANPLRCQDVAVDTDLGVGFVTVSAGPTSNAGMLMVRRVQWWCGWLWVCSRRATSPRLRRARCAAACGLSWVGV